MSIKRRTVESLCQWLVNGDEVDRCYAIQTLGVLGDTCVVPILAEYLHDEDIDVCIDTATALGNLGDPAAIPYLIESLNNDPDGEVCTAVVGALGQIGTQQIIPALLEVADARPENLVWGDGWDDWWDMQLKAVEALGRMGVVQAIPILRNILLDEDGQDIESEVLVALARIGGEGLDVLAERLRAKGGRERRRAIHALVHADSAMSVRMLGRALQDPSPDVRIAAIQALVERDAIQYLSAILLLLRDNNPKVRETAIVASSRLLALLEQRNPVIEQLFTLLADKNASVRTAALESLATVAAEHPFVCEQLEIIRGCLGDRTPAVARAACCVLGRRKDHWSIPQLLEILLDQDRDTVLCREAVLAVGAMGNTEDTVLNALTKAITDARQPVRLAALDALMLLEHIQRQREAQPECGGSRPLDVVIAAARGELISGNGERPTDSPGAGHFPNPSAQGNLAATSTLQAIAMDNIEAASALDEPQAPESSNSDKQPAESLLIAGKSHQQTGIAQDIRYLGARALGGSNTVSAVTALISLLHEKDVKLRRLATESITRIAQFSPRPSNVRDAVGILITHLRFGEVAIRVSGARALGYLGSPSAIPDLIDALEDENSGVRIEAIHALANLSAACIGHGKTEEGIAVRKIAERLKDTEPGVRVAASRALASMTLLSSQDEGDILEKLIEAALGNAGHQAQDMGKALRKINADKSAEYLLSWLDNARGSLERRIIFELLGELLCPHDRLRNL